MTSFLSLQCPTIAAIGRCPKSPRPRPGVDHVSGRSNRSSPTEGNGPSIRRDRHLHGPLALWRVAIALPVAACSSAPTMDLFGSYFPAWMPCAAIAVVAAIIIRQIPARSRLDY